MGVDIYGIAPALTSPKVERPENWEELSNEERNEFWEKRSKWEEENPGYYFRNNWWHWRPIVGILYSINRSAKLDITSEEFSLMSENSGGGISSPEKCIRIANALDQIVQNMNEQGVKNVYLNTGWWNCNIVDSEGRMRSMSVEDPKIAKAISDSVGDQEILFKLPVINGIEYGPNHGTNVENLQEFAVFLRNCNGFQVY